VPKSQSTFLKTEAGQIRPVISNVLHFIEQSSVLSTAIRFNELSMRIWTPGMPWDPTPHDWTDRDDVYLTSHIQEQADLMVGHILVRAAIEAYSRVNPYHPVCAFLQALEWDGQSRLDTWMIDFLGCVPTELQSESYLKEVGRCTLLSAVARACKPGCKVDTCLILEGEQGIGKSTAVKILAGPWHAESTADLGSKDSLLEIQTWVVELGELDTMGRADAGRLKAFLSRSTDRFRPPYGRSCIEVPRSCIFIGTVNPSEYLTDDTGARRFWPVECSHIHLDWLRREREQLWAEAYIRYLSGDTWWFRPEVDPIGAAQVQESRYMSDPWDDRVLSYANNVIDSGSRGVFVIDILTSALGFSLTDCDGSKARRVSKILKAQRWRAQPSRSGEPSRSKWYVPAF